MECPMIFNMNKKPIKFNVNNYVRVKLTPEGRKILLHEFDEFNKLSRIPIPPRKIEEDSKG